MRSVKKTVQWGLLKKAGASNFKWELAPYVEIGVKYFNIYAVPLGRVDFFNSPQWTVFNDARFRAVGRQGQQREVVRDDEEG